MKNPGFYTILFLMIFALITGCGLGQNSTTETQVEKTDTSAKPKSDNDTSISKKTTENKKTETVKNPAAYTGNDFTVISATSQQWHGGIRGSGGGVNYEICMITQFSSSQLIVDELWVGENSHEVAASKKSPETVADGFIAGDTIYIHFSDNKKDQGSIKDIEGIGDQKKAPETENNTPPPYKYDGEALIGYKIKGERKYKEINVITVLKPLYYP